MISDEPSPVITTQAFKFGTGRFGHPVETRAITLREAAILQGFPRRYRFVKPREDVYSCASVASSAMRSRRRSVAPSAGL